MASRIVSGINSVSGDSFTGMSVDEIRDTLSDTLQLNGDESAQLTRGGKTVNADGDMVLQDGDRLVFNRQAGVKG